MHLAEDLNGDVDLDFYQNPTMRNSDIDTADFASDNVFNGKVILILSSQVMQLKSIDTSNEKYRKHNLKICLFGNRRSRITVWILWKSTSRWAALWPPGNII